jgi:hypothetical protein
MKIKEKKIFLIFILFLISGIPINSEFTIYPEDAETEGTKSFFKLISTNELLLNAIGPVAAQDYRNYLYYGSNNNNAHRVKELN